MPAKKWATVPPPPWLFLGRGGGRGEVHLGLLYNHSWQKLYRQYLRNHSTQAEWVLWLSLRGRQVGGAKFRRQHGIGKYIVDFYCPEHRLAIEIDGISHGAPGGAESDRKRQVVIEQYGIQFLRFTDDQVLGNIDGVLAGIRSKLNEMANRARTTPLSPPR